MDWDYLFMVHAVARETIVQHGQVPFWNPYYCGGNLLLANADFPFFAPSHWITTLIPNLAIAFKVVFFLYLIVGMMGMFLLCKQLGLKNNAALLAAGMFGLAPPLIIRFTVGHPLAPVWFPYVLLFFLKMQKEVKYVLPACVFLSFALLEGPSEFFGYYVLFLSLFSVFYAIEKRSFRAITALGMVLLGTFLLSAFKLLPLFEFVRVSPRVMTYSVFEENRIVDIFNFLLKFVNIHDFYPVNNTLMQFQFWEGSMYIGWLGFLFFLVGLFVLFRRNKALLVSIACFFVLLLGGASPLNVWALLHRVFPFNSFHVINRLSVVIIFLVVLTVGYGYDFFERSYGKKKIVKYVLLVILILMLGNLIGKGWMVLGESFSIPAPSPSGSFFVQSNENNEGYYQGYSEGSVFINFLKKKGDISCKQDELRVPYAVSAIPQESDRYRGEAYLLGRGGNAQIESFSPNKIVVALQVLQNDRLVLNQNFFEGWKRRGGGTVEPYNGLVSVPVTPEDKKVTIFFSQKYFFIGIIFSVITLIFLIVVYVNGRGVYIFLGIGIVLVGIVLLASMQANGQIKERSSFYTTLGEEKGSFRIIELPSSIFPYHAFRYYQTIHKKEILTEAHPLGDVIGFLTNTDAKDIISHDQNDMQYLLAGRNVRWVLLHKSWIGSQNDLPEWNISTFEELRERLRERLGFEAFEDENLVAFRIPAIPKNFTAVLHEGWLEREIWVDKIQTRWIGDKATLKIYAFAHQEVQLNFTATAFAKSKIMDVYNNGRWINSVKINEFSAPYANISIVFPVESGENILAFKVRERCKRPSTLKFSADMRCLNVAFRNMVLQKYEL